MTETRRSFIFLYPAIAGRAGDARHHVRLTIFSFLFLSFAQLFSAGTFCETTGARAHHELTFYAPIL